MTPKVSMSPFHQQIIYDYSACIGHIHILRENLSRIAKLTYMIMLGITYP